MTHMYEISESLVKELENAVQQERNEQRKQQYVTLLQSQRNASSNLKSLGDANNTNSQTEAYDTEFAQEQNFTTSAYTQNTATNQDSAQKTSKLHNETTNDKK